MDGDRYFQLRNHMTGHVLQLRDSDPHLGTQLVVAPPSGNCEDQLFWQDFVTGTIRSKVKDMCIDVYGDRVVVCHYVNGNPNQQWAVAGSRLQNRVNPGWVLGVPEAKTPPRDIVIASLFTDSPGQSWTMDVPPPRFLHIRHNETGKYLVPRVKTEVSLVDKQTCRLLAAHGMWYQGHAGVLLTKFNDLALQSSSGGTIRLSPFRPGLSDQRWIISGEHVAESTNGTEALDVQTTHGEIRVCATERAERASQKWTFPFV